MSLPNLADVFLDFGVKDAVNMDGGGSTTFVVDFGAGPEVVNRPSDGGQRPVFSALCLEGQ
jgi:exopolysaccharide biosynthesis protein